MPQGENCVTVNIASLGSVTTGKIVTRGVEAKSTGIDVWSTLVSGDSTAKELIINKNN